jgi:uncharacterized alkaline shock family protein YloU
MNVDKLDSAEQTTVRQLRDVNEAAAPKATGTTAVHDETTVADGVVAQVAAIAATEVAGVHALIERGERNPVGRLLRRLAPARAGVPAGVTVRVGDDDVLIGLTMIVEYGASIPQVVGAVRSSVISRVQAMTGLPVRGVTIDVVGLHFAEQARRPQPEHSESR